MQDLEVKNGLIMLVEYFEQTTLLRFNNSMLTANTIPEDHSASITLFPNPTSSILNLKMHGENPVTTIKLYSTDGKLVFHESNLNTFNIQINCEAFASGLYYAIIHTKDSTSIRKILIQ